MHAPILCFSAVTTNTEKESLRSESSTKKIVSADVCSTDSAVPMQHLRLSSQSVNGGSAPLPKPDLPAMSAYENSSNKVLHPAY